MGVQYVNYLQMLDGSDKRDITQIMIAGVILSAIFTLILSKILKKPKYRLSCTKAVTGATFFGAWIAFVVRAFVYIPVDHSIVETVLCTLVLAAVIFCFCAVEWLMFRTKGEEDAILKKVLITQGTVLLILEIVYRILSLGLTALFLYLKFR